MEIANCSTAATELLIKEIVPLKILVPILITMATPITIRNRSGSAQESVVRHRITKIRQIAITVISAICTFKVSFNDLFSTAAPP